MYCSTNSAGQPVRERPDLSWEPGSQRLFQASVGGRNQPGSDMFRLEVRNTLWTHSLLDEKPMSFAEYFMNALGPDGHSCSSAWGIHSATLDRR